jgi:hypothetical protein
MTGGVRGIQALLSGSTSYYTGDPVGAIAVSLQGGTHFKELHWIGI